MDSISPATSWMHWPRLVGNNMHTVRTLLWLACCFTLAACSRQPEEYQRDFYAMGTLVSVQLYDVPEARATSAMDEIEAEFQEMHHDWHAWEDGPLVHLNKAIAHGETFTLPDVLAPLIPPAIELAERSDNLFNPAMGQLFHLWGFQGNARDTLPDQADIDAILKQHPRMSDLVLDGKQISSRNPAVQIDLGGFAKGWAVDLVIEQLKQQGIANAIVNAGGDLRAIGSHGERPWHIGIRNPAQAGAIAALDIQTDEAVFTSGDYERFFVINGKRYHHIIDPRTGWPAEGTTSLTVIHPNAATADAAATALFVAGDDWPRIARQMGIDKVMRIRSDGGVELSPAMQPRIQWLVPQDSAPIIRGYND